ncbi:hypothetical protein F1D05_37230 [Kribbella qitaiheensis]|uniref:SAF domain-containing protein n=1 Tax=Kribbella qitaiheensis TaxID=1544730 RepID=A0A7G6X8F3_9ACTN|nr:hypothetical protein [Kribbella qitaiheensis]QNE22518.1 hypothetical protein F1D05_37230 [Kribbella qitaiheensis]
MSFSSSSRPSASGARGKAPVSGSTRLPSGRERRPALAALAVILILLGAAGSALIAVRSGNRQDFVAISAEALPPGHKLVQKDLARGDLAGATGKLVLWSEAQKVLGKYTSSWLYEGQFVTEASVTDKPIPEGGALIGVSLESGRAPSSKIDDGDVVRIIRVPSANSEGAPQVLVGAALVTDSQGTVADTKTGNNTLNVTVLVPIDQSTAVAAAAAGKNLVLVKLSPGTKPTIARNDGDG